MNKESKLWHKVYSMLTRKQKRNFVFILVIMIASAILSQLLPLAIGDLTNDVLSQSDLSFTKVIPFLVFILLITVSNEILKVIRRLLVEDTSTSFEKTARTRAIDALLHAPLNFFRKNMIGHIHGRLNRSLEGVVKLIKLVFMDFAPAVFNGIAAIIVIFSQLPPELAFLMFMVVPIGTIIVLRQISTQKGIRVQLMEEKSTMDGAVVELINGIEVIRVTDNVSTEVERFDNQSENLRSKEMRHHRSMAFYDCLKFINEAVFTVIVIGVSTFLAGKGEISVGAVLTSYLCFTQLTTPLRELHRILDELSESSVLAESYFEILDLPQDFSYRLIPAPEKLFPSNALIEIRHLKFAYGEEKTILNNLDLEIKENSFICLVGPSGCGKSSLIKVLLRLEDYQDGEIVVDGSSLRDLAREEIANLMALVPQTPFLIAASIRKNIAYGMHREVSDAEIHEAARRANISDFIEQLPEGYETILAESGSNLSGGQRQRIAIARVFLRKPKILILDEATSALDNTSERYIQDEIEKMQKENHTTVISIAHRLSTLRNTDEIIVFSQGKIAQRGKFDALKDRAGIFQDMYLGKLK